MIWAGVLEAWQKGVVNVDAFARQALACIICQNLHVTRKYDKIDLVILDMNMPGMDGEATWWSLRKRTKDLPILLSSGYPEQMVNLEGARSAEIDGFIQKPYRKRDLMRQLALLLARPGEAQG